MVSTIILIGDVRQRLRQMPSESVNCVVTSPPYFGLRDYGCDGQIGLEATPDAYVAELVAVFREVRRVLRADGTLWLNLGDSYAGSWGARGRGEHTNAARSDLEAKHGTSAPNRNGFAPWGCKPKDRMMIPARVALALQSDGWWLRDEIIWHKPNPMPVSVTDRTTPAHEMLYMFSKSARYHYNMEAVKEPCVKDYGKSKDFGGFVNKSRLKRGTRDATGDTLLSPSSTDSKWSPDKGRQPRSVWKINTRPFKGAHFATFPPDLIRPCILAGCPASGTVLDPFFGAGTTGLVAAELSRNAIGIELNPEYGAIAAERLGLRAVTPEGDMLVRAA
jgi:DNA modification methylase